MGLLLSTLAIGGLMYVSKPELDSFDVRKELGDVVNDGMQRDRGSIVKNVFVRGLYSLIGAKSRIRNAQFNINASSLKSYVVYVPMKLCYISQV